MTGEIGAALISLQEAFKLTKTMIGIRDATKLEAQAAELNGIIVQAQVQAMAANEAYTAQINRIHQLEKEIADAKAWEAKKQNYELKSIGASGAFAYMLKRELRGSEPAHWLCQTCYANSKESLFQFTGETPGRKYKCVCPVCAATIFADAPPGWL